MISAALIVKNEKDHIRDVLESLRGFDEIVVCDTGSTDTTVDIAREYTDKVFTDYVWEDHYANARNHAKSKCTGDWILSIDADEKLEEGGLEKIRGIVNNATHQKSFSVVLSSMGQNHHAQRLFKNDPDVKWVGRAHETIEPVEKNITDIRIDYGYSTAHQLDPDRMLRIITKELDEHPTSSRTLYYLGREYYYRRQYDMAAELFLKSALNSTWNPEKADAYLYVARCYFYSFRGDEAREACIKAIQLNLNFREALIFMAEMHYSPWKEKWLQFAELATNEGVLFDRVRSIVTSKIPKKLHHIWVGPKKPPLKWMNTWREKHPDWEYTLWDNDSVFGRTWKNQKQIDYYRDRGVWHGVADIVRYEILHEQGGFMPGADSICENPIDELFTDGYGAYAVYENEKVRPGLVSPLYACEPGNRFARALIEGIGTKEVLDMPWISTGNTHMKETLAKTHFPVKVFPSYVFNPVHYTGETYMGTGKIYGRQMWGTTHNNYDIGT